MIPRLMLFIIFTVLVAASLSSFASTIPSVGTMAPDFTLESQEGKAVSLSQYRGMWVVLYFYPKDFTSGCTMEAHNFQRDEAQYEKKRAVVLGVSVDSSDSHQQFCSKEGLSFKLLADTEHKVSRMYGSLNNLGLFKFAARHTFIINPEGKIVSVFTDVNPKNHSEEVLATLSALQKHGAR